ncbi:MAG: ABC transporter permease [Acidobacteria bacterium]|nr:ABC transporter permease [Acidobacteriota bacterium]
METLWQDLRYGTRQLLRSPGFTAVAVLTLALGIGGATVIFSAVNPILFEPLPYPHPDRIMMVWDIFESARSEVTFHTYREIAERNRSFDALAILEPWQPTMAGSAEPERLDGQSVSYGYFRVLGIAPEMGRDFQPSDSAFHGPKVAILSYGLWQRRFGGDHGIVGRQITLNGDSYTVIGVMPRGFENVLAPTVEIWSPEQYDRGHITDTNTAEWGHHLRMVGRLRPDVSFAQAKADIDRIARAPVAEFPRPRWAALRVGFIVDSLQGDVTRGVKPALLAVLGAVMLVLLIACVNVTNLLLARGVHRRGEFAMRAALGAGRMRMVRQLLTESLLLAVLGGVLGMVVAEFGVEALLALSPPGLPRAGAIGVDSGVFAFAFGITTLIGLAVGLIPALHASRSNLNAGLQQSSRRTTGGHQSTRGTLVVAEVALALVLLVSAGLLLRSLQRLFAVDPGFDASHLLTMQVQTSGHRFDDDSTARRFFAEALEEVRQVPGVTAAAFTSLLPLTDDTQFGVYGTEFEKDKNSYDTFRYVVTPGYFETMCIPLRRGRFLDKRDVASAPFAVVISESLATQEFGNDDPIGQRVHVGGFPNWPWYTIVGVVGDVRQASLAAGNLKAAYITPEQSWFGDQAMSLVIRTRGDAAALVPAIRKAVWSVDKDQPIVRIAMADDLLAASAAQRRFALILFEVFAVVALVLAAAGIYGVLAGRVAERTQEIGVRTALGASPGSILALVLRQGMMLTGLGVTIGLAGAAAASQVIAVMLFGVSRFDAATYVGATLLLLGVSGVACWVPARRAMRVDPMVALRYE